jgi:hypothetical protein
MSIREESARKTGCEAVAGADSFGTSRGMAWMGLSEDCWNADARAHNSARTAILAG